MKNILLSILLLIPTAYAAEDICCVLKSVSGDSVQTFVWIMSDDTCKSGGTYQGKQICAAVKDPQNTYCGSESSKADRCGKCGYFWSGKECLTEDPVKKAKKQFEDEQAQKEAAEKSKSDADKPASEKPATVRPVTPSAPSTSSTPPPPQDPDGDQVFSRAGKGKSKGMDPGN